MLDKFPGYLGYSGIIAIHADWPIYPPGMGWEIALKTLGNFPPQTNFFEIDDIDRCKLLINQPPQKLAKPPCNSDYYHAAVWHEDLIELKAKGFIEGILAKSDYEFEMICFENFKRELGKHLKLDENGNIILYLKADNGNVEEIKYYKPVSDEEDEDEESLIFRNCAVIPKSINLTDRGFKELIKLSNEIKLVDELKSLTQPIIEIKRFDTAIRDASLLLETKIKEFHKNSLHGQELVEFHVNKVIKNNDNFNSAAIKCYRGELRTIFKFIRNDFAHNFRVLTEEQCKLILSRISNVLLEFEEMINGYFNKNDT